MRLHHAITTLRKRLSQEGPMPLLMRNTLWMVSTHVLRLFLRIIYFVLLTRALGAQQYGAFVATTALVSLCYPFVSLGMGNLLVKNVARNKATFSTYWGNTLFVTAISGLVLALVLLPLSKLILPPSIPLGLVALVAITDLLLSGSVDAAAKAFQSVAWLSHTGIIFVAVNLARVTAATIAILYFPELTAFGWGVAYLLSTAVPALLGLLMVTHDLGWPRLALHEMRAEAGEGLCFCLSHSSQKLHTQMDKVMLARMSTLEITGTYSAAARLIDVALIPVQALMQAAYPRFFTGGAVGIKGGIAVARQLLPVTMALGALASVGIFFCAPLVPLLLGEEYRASIDAMRWLCPLPLLRAVYLPASDALSGAGYQGTRCSLLGLAAALNLIANIQLIPLYAWRGAAWAAVGADSFLVGALWLTVTTMSRREGERSTP